jgi:transcriptional regulator with XRE-family HTH domain
MGQTEWGIFPPSSMGETSPSAVLAGPRYTPCMSGLDRERLKALIQEKNLTPRSLSLAVGPNPYLVRDILSAKSKNPRSDTMTAIAARLGVPVLDLMTDGDGDLSPATRQHEQMMLPIIRRVQAGAWLAVDEISQVPPKFHPAVRDPRYPTARQWLSEVIGDSVNKLHVFEGDLVHCVDAIDIGYFPKTGDLVEVERQRYSAREREITLKQVEVTRRGVELWPRSTNPIWNGPILLDGGLNEGEEAEVRIAGLVLSAIRRF